MRILIVFMVVMVEISGFFFRVVVICNKLVERDYEVVFCVVKDVNYKIIENIKNYYVLILLLFGMLMFFGKRMFKIG